MDLQFLAVFSSGLLLQGSINVGISVFLFQYDKDNLIINKIQEFLKINLCWNNFHIC